jgi:hypothetical protein
MVVGRSAPTQRNTVDTAIVQVVRRQPDLRSISIAPGTTTLTSGLSQTFLVTGYLKNGRPVPVGVNWSATGGTIDAGGNYVAGDSAGTYHVIATDTRLTLSDTATIVINAAAQPPAPAEPPPPPPPPPAPVLASVTLTPGTATLAPSATRQFTAFGRTTAGDSISIQAAYTATGGTITPGGLFTAGPNSGAFRVIATSGNLADTASITVTVPSGSGPGAGLPFGAFWGWDGTNVKPDQSNFNISVDATDAGIIIPRINAARSKGLKLLLGMTGGKHTNYMTDGVFDMPKWIAKMDTYKTSAIKAAVAAGVADGTIIGNVVMDEPNHHSWGPKGTMTKAEVDWMVSYVKAIFPTLTVGVAHKHNTFEPTKSYKVVDFVLDQYSSQQGDVTAFRDAGLAMARRDGYAVMFSINILDGGTTIAGCPIPETGGVGTFGTRCRVTPEQLEEWGTLLGVAGCALTMWRFDSVFMASTANQRAFKKIADLLATQPKKSCRRQ